jgi:hypothetical protein
MDASDTKQPTVKELLATMAEAGGWYIRKRRGLRPALWRSATRGAFAPATPQHVEEWLLATHPVFADYTKLDLRMVAEGVIAEGVIAEARHHGCSYGLPVLDENTLGFVS